MPLASASTRSVAQDGAPEGRDVVAAVEVPLESGTVADAEDQVVLGERLIKERAKSRNVGGEPEVKRPQMGRDDPREASALRRRRDFSAKAQRLTEESEGLVRARRITAGMVFGV